MVIAEMVATVLFFLWIIASISAAFYAREVIGGSDQWNSFKQSSLKNALLRFDILQIFTELLLAPGRIFFWATEVLGLKIYVLAGMSVDWLKSLYTPWRRDEERQD